jgi:hypothetical protein
VKVAPRPVGALPWSEHDFGYDNRSIGRPKDFSEYSTEKPIVYRVPRTPLPACRAVGFVQIIRRDPRRRVLRSQIECPCVFRFFHRYRVRIDAPPHPLLDGSSAGLYFAGLKMFLFLFGAANVFSKDARSVVRSCSTRPVAGWELGHVSLPSSTLRGPAGVIRAL